MSNFKNPRISIIVPCFNSEKYLEKCMDSIVSQTFRDIEIIAVNDGSRDRSLEILKKYEDQDERVRIIDKSNEGVSAARNTALKKARGQCVMFVDSDDWVDKDTCEKAVTVMEDHNADVVMWSYTREFANSSRHKKIFNEDMIIFEDLELAHKLHRRFVGPLGTELSKPENMDALSPVWGKLYKRNIIEDNNITFEDIRNIGTYEDGLFNLYVFNFVRKAVYIGEPLYHYRKDNPSSITSGPIENFRKQREKLIEIMDGYIISNNLSLEYRTALKNRTALSVLGIGLINLSGNGSIDKKMNELGSLLRDVKYKEALNEITLRSFPLNWKVFYYFAKNGFTPGVFFLLLVVSRIINRRRAAL
ncbi:MAG: glycosyltransferase [Clostridiaceae bacterium]